MDLCLNQDLHVAIKDIVDSVGIIEYRVLKHKRWTLNKLLIYTKTWQSLNTHLQSIVFDVFHNAGNCVLNAWNISTEISKSIFPLIVRGLQGVE